MNEILHFRLTTEGKKSRLMKQNVPLELNVTN